MSAPVLGGSARAADDDKGASTARPTVTPASTIERMDIVVVGHVDHGKSTVIGRLMADTGSLPEGKLDQVRAMCARNARPFEYAFLLDALRDERAQGITIDTARCFFATEKRRYIIHDAPGHVEFLKNMVTGAARAEAALLVIDAAEGIRENTMRHGYILSMLGIRQVVVLVNKMDLVGWDSRVFRAVADEYGAFLAEIGIGRSEFIPISARDGANIVGRATDAPWYSGPTVLDAVDSLVRREGLESLAFRMPVQDIYKFTAEGDDRRIVVGTVESGVARPGDEVVFLPSGKRSRIATIEAFAAEPPSGLVPDAAVGITLTEQVYVRPGELMTLAKQPEPEVSRRLRASMFWMGRAPMVRGRRYKLRIGSAQVAVELAEVTRVLDASDLGSVKDKQQLDRHDVAECVLEAAHPVAYDLADANERTARFAIVDGFDIAACGVVLAVGDDAMSLLEDRVRRRESAWSGGEISVDERRERYAHKGKFVVVLGSDRDGAPIVGRALERALFELGAHTYYLGLGRSVTDLDPAEGDDPLERAGRLRRLGELARIMTDAGLLFVTAPGDIDEYELEDLRMLAAPFALFVVRIGEASAGLHAAQLSFPARADADAVAEAVARELVNEGVLPEYYI